jgi:hypothetical protein
VALADGRPGEAIQRALDAIDLGAHAGRGAPVIHHLVGGACAAIGVAQAERCVERLSLRDAHAAGQRLDGILARFPSGAEALTEERQVALTGIRQVFQGEIAVSELAGERGETAPTPGFPFRRWSLYPKRWSYDAVDRSYTAIIVELNKPDPQRKPVPIPREPSSQILVPVMEKAGFRFTANETQLRLLRLELALQEYRQRHHQYPARLEQLVPEVFPALPADPFTARPMVYRTTGASCVLYSLGPDGIDVGGSQSSAMTWRARRASFAATSSPAGSTRSPGGPASRFSPAWESRRPIANGDSARLNEARSTRLWKGDRSARDTGRRPAGSGLL